MTSMNGRRGRAQEADDAAAAGSLDSLSANTLTLVLSGSALVAPLMAASLLPSALTMLALDEASLCNLDFVRTLAQLEVLSCCHNRISSLAPLSSLRGLRHLALASNEVDDFNELRHLSRLHLRSLDLRFNTVRGTPDFARLCRAIVPSLRTTDECDAPRLVPSGQSLVSSSSWQTLSHVPAVAPGWLTPNKRHKQHNGNNNGVAAVSENHDEEDDVGDDDDDDDDDDDEDDSDSSVVDVARDTAERQARRRALNERAARGFPQAASESATKPQAVFGGVIEDDDGDDGDDDDEEEDDDDDESYEGESSSTSSSATEGGGGGGGDDDDGDDDGGAGSEGDDEADDGGGGGGGAQVVARPVKRRRP